MTDWGPVGRNIILDILTSLQVYAVNAVVTRLFNLTTNKPIPNSQLEKRCFVKKCSGVVEAWYIYIHNDAELTLDTLVPVAEVVNDMLSRYLGDAVLYLLPILACKESEISRKLDSLNVREDQTRTRDTRTEHLPKVGEIVQADDQSCLTADANYVFPSGDYIGYSTPGDLSYKYGVVNNRVGPARYNVLISPGAYAEMDTGRMRYFKR